MSLPLRNIRVLDVSQVWAIPRLGRWLADMGAEVIKVESITRYDTTRGTVRPAPGEGRSSRGVERRLETGQGVVLRLLPQAFRS